MNIGWFSTYLGLFKFQQCFIAFSVYKFHLLGQIFSQVILLGVNCKWNYFSNFLFRLFVADVQKHNGCILILYSTALLILLALVAFLCIHYDFLEFLFFIFCQVICSLQPLWIVQQKCSMLCIICLWSFVFCDLECLICIQNSILLKI